MVKHVRAAYWKNITLRNNANKKYQQCDNIDTTTTQKKKCIYKKTFVLYYKKVLGWNQKDTAIIFQYKSSSVKLADNKDCGVVLPDKRRKEIHSQSEVLKMDETGICITSYLFLPSEAHRTWRS